MHTSDSLRKCANLHPRIVLLATAGTGTAASANADPLVYAAFSTSALLRKKHCYAFNVLHCNTQKSIILFIFHEKSLKTLKNKREKIMQG